MASFFKGLKKKNSVCGMLEGVHKSDEKEDSISEMEKRFRSE